MTLRSPLRGLLLFLHFLHTSHPALDCCVFSTRAECIVGYVHTGMDNVGCKWVDWIDDLSCVTVCKVCVSEL